MQKQSVNKTSGPWSKVVPSCELLPEASRHFGLPLPAFFISPCCLACCQGSINVFGMRESIDLGGAVCWPLKTPMKLFWLWSSLCFLIIHSNKNSACTLAHTPPPHCPSVSEGILFQGPLPQLYTTIRGHSSPLHKMVRYLHITCTHPPVYVKPFNTTQNKYSVNGI